MRKYLLITTWVIGSISWLGAQSAGGTAQFLPPEPEAKPLGAAINSIADEYFPVLSPDGNTLYLTRNGHAQNVGPDNRQDIWVTYRLPEGSWSRTINVGGPLNDRYDNQVVNVSPSGRKLYLIQQAANTVQVLESRREGRSWVRPIPVDLPSGIQPAAIHPSSGGQVVLFSMPATNGSLDLYCIRRQQNGRWSPTVNLGAEINTPADEKDVLMAADGETLYFTSNGLPGMGGLDWWVSRRLDNSWTRWSTPRHLGNTINTPQDDGPIAVSNQGGEVYFSRWTSNQGYDIFQAVLPEELRPRPVAIISGQVLQANRIGHTPHLTVSPLEENYDLRQLELEPDGRYTLIVPFGSDVGLSAEAKGFYAVSEHFKMAPQRLKELDAGQNLLASRELDPSYLQRESEIQNLQLRLRKLDDELRQLNEQRQASRKQLDLRPASTDISDPQLDALRHRFNYFVFQDTSRKENPRQEIRQRPETYETTIKGTAGEDEELVKMKKEYRKFFGEEEQEKGDQWLWKEEASIGENLLSEAAREASSNLSPEEQQLLRLREEELRAMIRSGLTGPSRQSGMAETSNSADIDWKNHLGKDALFSKTATRPQSYDVGPDAELKTSLKKALQSDLVYSTKAEYQSELRQELEEKLNQQMQAEEQLVAKGPSLKSTPAVKEKKKPALQEIRKDLRLVPVESGQVIPLNNVFFEANSARLKKASAAELDRLVQFLRQNEALTIEIGAHTHGWISHAQAMSLSKQRAATVANYLLVHGISSGRVQYRGYGKTQPVTTNETEEGRQQNQRIEMKILP